MKQLFSRAYTELQNGGAFVLCSIIASSGSTPRGSGAKMAVFPDGSTVGTIGGGAVEHHSIELAREVLASKENRTAAFRLKPNSVADIGMVCGGDVSVYFQYFSAGDSATLSCFSAICAALESKKNTWLITELGDERTSIGLYSREDSLQFLDASVLSVILPHLSSRAVLVKGDPSYYVEPLSYAETVYVFGGGHVSFELVPVLSRVGFSVCVFEDREEFGTQDRFPTAEARIIGDYQSIGAQIEIKDCDYVVIMTRGHQGDFEVLRQALQTDASYIGVIGSRHKIALTNKRLLECGIPESELSRIHTPIGLSIGAETPAEIAISIAAEMIRHRAEKRNQI